MASNHALTVGVGSVKCGIGSVQLARVLLGLVLGSSTVAELGAKSWELWLVLGFWTQQSEEGMMFNTNLPQSLGSSVILQLEPDCGLKMFKFSGSYFDVESVTFV